MRKVQIIGPNAWGYFWIKNPLKRFLFYFLGHPHPYGRLRAYRLFKFLKTPSQVLDMGCGEGVFSRELAKRNFEVIGLDIDASAIHVAKTIAKNEQLPITYYVADVCDTKLADESFNLIICTDVIEHVKYPQKALFEISRLLKTGGEAIITVPTPLYLHKNYFSHNLSMQLETIGHQHHGWCKDEFESMLKDEGLKLEGYGYFGHPLMRFCMETLYVVAGSEGIKKTRKDLYNLGLKSLLLYLCLCPVLFLDILWSSDAKGAFLVVKCSKVS